MSNIAHSSGILASPLPGASAGIEIEPTLEGTPTDSAVLGPDSLPGATDTGLPDAMPHAARFAPDVAAYVASSGVSPVSGTHGAEGGGRASGSSGGSGSADGFSAKEMNELHGQYGCFSGFFGCPGRRLRDEFMGKLEQRLGAEATRQLLIAMLKHNEPWVRRACAILLADIGTLDVVAPLALIADATNEPVDMVRTTAAFSLATMGREEAIPQLIACLNGGGPDRFLVHVDDGSHLGRTYSNRTSQHALERLAQFNKPEVRRAIIEGMFVDIDTAGWYSCDLVRDRVEVLGKFGSSDVIPTLMKVAFEPLPEYFSPAQNRAMKWLGMMGVWEALPHLLGKLESNKSDHDTRLYAASAIGDLAAREALYRTAESAKIDFPDPVTKPIPQGFSMSTALPALFRALDDEFPDVQIASASAIVRIPGYDRDELINALAGKQYSYYRDQIGVLKILGATGGQKSLSLILKALDDPHRDVAVIAAEVSGWLGLPAAAAVLRTKLRDPDPQIRASIASTLGRVGSAQDAIALFKVAGNDHSSFVRSTATEAISRLLQRFSDLAPPSSTLTDDHPS